MQDTRFNRAYNNKIMNRRYPVPQQPAGHLITLTSFARNHYFNDKKVCQEIYNSLKELKEKYPIKVLAYSMVSYNMFLILQTVNDDMPIEKFLQIFKGRTTHLFWKLGFHNKLWQRSFKAQFLKSNFEVKDKILYVLGNPVKKSGAIQKQKLQFCGVIDKL